jgi:hypothetical protein
MPDKKKKKKRKEKHITIFSLFSMSLPHALLRGGHEKLVKTQPQRATLTE